MGTFVMLIKHYIAGSINNSCTKVHRRILIILCVDVYQLFCYALLKKKVGEYCFVHVGLDGLSVGRLVDQMVSDQ